nr:cupin domain-containing protein [Synechocystis sp. PCC 7509]
MELAPGSASALRHWHDKQDEFIYVLAGEITLVTDEGEKALTVGDCAGFPAGVVNGHCLINRSQEIVTYLEIGDRTSDDQVTYPDDDLIAEHSASGWIFKHKDGKLY